MSEDFETFLQKRKLTADSLKEARSASKLGGADPTPASQIITEEESARLETRLRHYPFTVNDVLRERFTLMTSMIDKTQDVCYDMCQEENDLTFLSIKEAKCFRNCVTKIGYLVPALQKSFNQADTPSFKYQQELTEQLREKYGKPTPNISIYEPQM